MANQESARARQAQASRILAAWTALEALSPQTYRRPEDLGTGDRRCVVDLSTGHLPWLAGEDSRPRKQLYYHVVLGAIRMDRATEALVKAFGTSEERSPPAKEKAAIGVLLIDRNGILAGEHGVALSSFAWALPLAMQRKLETLGAWSSLEHTLVERLDAMVRRLDADGNPVPLDMPTIHAAHRWLVSELGLATQLVERPSFALRVYHSFKARNPPEALLLNSFFLDDLGRAAALVDSGHVPTGLRRYLAIETPAQTFDLLTDKAALERALAPASMPGARWPGPGGHPLVTLQQAAVNLARTELAEGEGSLAVNGPPGTGKTTLLRDIVAACVLDRAVAMAAFDEPAQAFTPSGVTAKAGEQATFRLYSLAPSLRGHEVLVASSNNKAVENVSKELPAARAIGRSTDEVNYFKTVSDRMHAREDRDDESSEPSAPRSTNDTWGLIAAVLGNARNRAAFQQSFWWDVEWSFRLYLKAAKGDPVGRKIKDPRTGQIEQQQPPIVLAEHPPTPAQAKVNWRTARQRFLALKLEVDAELAALEKVRQQCLKLSTMPETATLEQALATLAAQEPELTDRIDRATQAVTAARRAQTACARRVDRHGEGRPGIFARMFRSGSARTWAQAHAPLVKEERTASSELRRAERALAQASAAGEQWAIDTQDTQARIAKARRQKAKAQHVVDAQRSKLGDRLVDEQFFARGHEASNLAAPWVPDALHRKREDLFIAALAVHRAFVDASAQRVLHNLSALMDVFASGRVRDETQRPLLGDLWSTFFLVVPVVSTTFASVGRMLSDLPAGGLGWLLIDEAGQSLPQAAVGAMLRARRSIVVGDPLQIPPVVTLPDRLTFEICAHFEVDAWRWAAPDASAQTLADRASRFQAAFRSDQGPRLVGVPLLVHRRCQEPMFGICNRIAYDGQMVHAVGQHTSAIGNVLGPSAWFDVDGEADSKWCPAEGALVVRLLERLAQASVTEPDLFLITPFRIVAQELRRRLLDERQVFGRFGVDPDDWINQRVGTIHTVQGREAEAVILILGAPTASQHGARSWATSAPNIVNVAVSRAKQRLYVVGARGAWSGAGHARELAAALEHVRA
jgi:hypothetical protein